jgi:hypothetical protein
VDGTGTDGLIRRNCGWRQVPPIVTRRTSAPYSAVWAAPVSRQKQPKRSATSTIRRKRTAGKSTKPIDIPPLITVWLQVRILPGPPAFARFASYGSASQRTLSEAKRVKAAAPKPKGRRRATTNRIATIPAIPAAALPARTQPELVAAQLAPSERPALQAGLRDDRLLRQ